MNSVYKSHFLTDLLLIYQGREDRDNFSKFYEAIGCNIYLFFSVILSSQLFSNHSISEKFWIRKDAKL